MKKSLVIPAYNEEENIESVLKGIPRSYEIVVIDDNSSDYTSNVSRKYAKVLKNTKNLGYEKSLKGGLLKSSGDIVLTMDGDGEHDPKDIKRFLDFTKDYDFVIGQRTNLPRMSEYFMAWLVRRVVPEIRDPANGFRAIKRKVINSISLDKMCFGCCLLLRAHRKGFKIKTVEIKTKRRKETRIKFFSIIGPILSLTKEVLAG